MRIPDLNFKFPNKSYKDKLAKDRIKLRYCQRAWFDIKYISFYQLFKETGWYLLPCMFIIFPSNPKHGEMAKSPYYTAPLQLER